jgi:hypothetical protein
MDFIELVNSESDRDCESKKKISFSQKSPIDTKKSKTEKEFNHLGYSFSINKDEVIESALFDRIKRDCGGKLIRVTAVRRFRKVGSDEWFSVEASIGNDTWDNDFVPSNNAEAIEQGKGNNDKDNGHDSNSQVSYNTSMVLVNPFEDAKKREARKKKIIGLFIVLGVTTSIVVGFKLIKK